MLVDFLVRHHSIHTLLATAAADATGGGGGGGSGSGEGAIDDDVSAWALLLAVWRAKAYDGGVDDRRVFEERGFEFSRGDLPAADFDHFL